jgi:hypothetical protein
MAIGARCIELGPLNKQLQITASILGVTGTSLILEAVQEKLDGLAQENPVVASVLRVINR